MSISQSRGQPPRIVSRDEWLAARIELLAREKELTAMKDRLAAERRRLPWVRVEKDYLFEGPAGAVTLSQLFDGRSQLFIKRTAGEAPSRVQGGITQKVALARLMVLVSAAEI